MGRYENRTNLNVANVTLGARTEQGILEDPATPSRMLNEGTFPKLLSKHLAFQDFVLQLNKSIPSAQTWYSLWFEIKTGKGWVARQLLEDFTQHSCPGLRALVSLFLSSPGHIYI